MNVCAKCGFENNANVKKCSNCLTDLHWAKVNLGKFHGNADDTRRIGIESRKERGVPVPEDESTPLEPIHIEKKSELPLTDWDAVKLGIMIGFIPLVFIFVIGSMLTSSLFIGMYIAGLLGTFLGVPSGIIGALIGKNWKNTRYATQVGGVLGTFLGIGLWNLLFVLSGAGYGIY